MRPSFRHRLVNLIHSALLLGGMALISWVATAALAGPVTGLWVLAGLCIGLLFAPAAPKEMLLRLYGARPLGPREFPLGVELARRIAERADLPRPPTLHYLPSRAPNAFALGGREDSAIAISDGLLRMMDRREFAGVLAHEIAHVANGDLWIMALADTMTRATALLSQIGQIVLFVNLPLFLMGAVTIPWIVPIVLILAPVAMSLLQLALSRAREFDADRGAAQLTGDPMGLASALSKLERRTGRLWEELVMPGRRIPEPSILRTHPPTEDRIERLKELSDGRDDTPPAQRPLRVTRRLEPVIREPRMHWTGLWY
jgi:heat shock protein HtpX